MIPKKVILETKTRLSHESQTRLRHESQTRLSHESETRLSFESQTRLSHESHELIVDMKLNVSNKNEPQQQKNTTQSYIQEPPFFVVSSL